MTKRAIIEIETILADRAQREQRAKAYAEQRVRELGAAAGHERWHSDYLGILYSQEAMYNPEWMVLDQPVAGAAQALSLLRDHDYDIRLVTARPHWMQLATETWLQQHGMLYDALLCKNFATRERYVRTATWKTEVVFALVASSTTILYVDADTRSLEAVERLTAAHILTRASLASLDLQAIQAIEASITGASTMPFVLRTDRVDTAVIYTPTGRIERRFREEAVAQRFCDLWNRVVGPPRHCGNCDWEIAEEEQMYGHRHYLALCFACSCANEGD